MQSWLVFVGASIVLLAVPGPTALVILRCAAKRDRPAIAGIVTAAAIGDLVALAACSLGLGAALAASSHSLFAIRTLAALYLVVMGLSSLFSSANNATRRAGAGASFRSVFVVTACNPKGLAFFAAFLPQFIDPSRNVAIQTSVMAATFTCLSCLSAFGWATGGARVAHVLRSPVHARRMRHAVGLLLLGSGIADLIVEAA